MVLLITKMDFSHYLVARFYMEKLTLTLQIEDLLEKNCSDFELSKLFKKYIKEYYESMPEIFQVNQGKDFLVKHTKKMDDIISFMYKTVVRRIFGNYLPMLNSIPISIVALGSYGREQLSLHSDIDLMIVYESCAGYHTNDIIEKLLYLAWDAGLKLGHRVHEVKDISKAASEDITIKTALFESRFILGSRFTWHATQRNLTALRHHEPKEFILAKIEEAHTRRKKYPASMQPNVKEGVGSLRDSHLLFWIAHVIYGVHNIKELQNILYSEEEYKDYRTSLELIFRVRNALHFISNKQQDQLVLDEMPKVARLLGFRDETHLIPKVLHAQFRINNFTQVFVKKMIRPYLTNSYSLQTIKEARIERNFYVLEGRLYTSYHQEFKSITLLLEFLNRLEDKVWQFDPSFVYHFSNAIFTETLTTKTFVQLRKLFLKSNLYPFLQLFYDAGILHKLITPFQKVLHLPQFDGYHNYPVDIHSIKCVEALENIKDPYIQELYANLHSDERLLLKTSVLIHDTGKGRKQDHSEVGAKLITAFTKELKFSEMNQKRAALLIKHHVLMSNVAQRANIYNEKVLYKFMSQIGNKYNLTLLYILTYADVNGVGREVYNSFTANLLRELYELSLEIESQDNRISDASRRLKIEKRIQNLDSFKNQSRMMQKKILTIESNLFYFKHTPKDIVTIATTIKDIKNYSYKITNEKTLSIEIFRKVPFNLSFLLSSLTFMDVASMEVVTLFDNTKYFKIEFFESVFEDNIEHIQTIIDLSFDMSQDIIIEKPVIKQGEATLDCEHSMTYAELSVYTQNQKGLLAFIVHTLDSLNIDITTAKIYTTKTRARDNFLIDKEQDMCHNSEKLLSLLTS